MQPDAKVQWSSVTVDCRDPELVARFWSALLGRPTTSRPDGWVFLGDRGDSLPRLLFQPVPEPKHGKTRIHLDLAVDDIEDAIRQVVTLGGTPTGERHEGGSSIVVPMRDPEGNEFCLVRH